MGDLANVASEHVRNRARVNMGSLQSANGVMPSQQPKSGLFFFFASPILDSFWEGPDPTDWGKKTRGNYNRNELLN